MDRSIEAPSELSSHQTEARHLSHSPSFRSQDFISDRALATAFQEEQFTMLEESSIPDRVKTNRDNRPHYEQRPVGRLTLAPRVALRQSIHAVVGLAIAGLWPCSVQGAEIIVTSQSSVIDAGTCSFSFAAKHIAGTPAQDVDLEISDLPGLDGEVTLHEAICAANGTAGADTIVLERTAYTLTAPHNHWYGPTGLPPIYSEIIIEGNGAVIERSSDNDAPPFRLLYVAGNLHAMLESDSPNGDTPGPPRHGTLTLRDLTLQGGFARGGDGGDAGPGVGGGGAGMGGAIFSQGTLHLERVALIGNHAEGGDGGSTLGGVGLSGGGGMGSDGGSWVPVGHINLPGGGFESSTVFVGSRLGGDGTYDQDNLLSPDGGYGGGFADGIDGGGGEGSINPFPKASTAGGGGFGSGGLSGAQEVDFGLPGGAQVVDFGLPGGVGGGGGGGGGDTKGLGRGGHGGFGGGGGGYQAESGSNGGPGGNGGFGGGAGGVGNVFNTASGGFGGGDGDGTASGLVTYSILGGGGAGFGGGVFNHFGTLRVLNSTLSNNSATRGEGSLHSDGTRGNPGEGRGGAIFNLNGTVALESSTLASNSASTDGTAVYNLFWNDEVGNTVAAVTTTPAATVITIRRLDSCQQRRANRLHDAQSTGPRSFLSSAR